MFSTWDAAQTLSWCAMATTERTLLSCRASQRMTSDVSQFTSPTTGSASCQVSSTGGRLVTISWSSTNRSKHSSRTSAWRSRDTERFFSAKCRSTRRRTCNRTLDTSARCNCEMSDFCSINIFFYLALSTLVGQVWLDDVLDEPFSADLHVVAFHREEYEFAFFFHLFQSKLVLRKNLTFLESYELSVWAGFVESKPTGLDGRHDCVVFELHHDELFQFLEAIDVVLVDFSLVVDLSYESASRLVDVFVKWIMPVSGLHEKPLHPSSIGGVVEDLSEILAGFCSQRWAVWEPEDPLMLSPDRNEIFDVDWWTLLHQCTAKTRK